MKSGWTILKGIECLIVVITMISSFMFDGAGGGGYS